MQKFAARRNYLSRCRHTIPPLQGFAAGAGAGLAGDQKVAADCAGVASADEVSAAGVETCAVAGASVPTSAGAMPWRSKGSQIISKGSPP